MKSEDKKISFARSYSDVPQETKDYAKLICNVHAVGNGCGMLYSIDSMRIKMHEAMATAYGLDYESTKDAVDDAVVSSIDALDEKKVAILVDATLCKLLGERRA